jgi:hypothetical protein
MNPEEIFKIIGFIVVGVFLYYYFGKCMIMQTSLIEGLENKDVSAKTSKDAIAANAVAYTEELTNLITKLQDELLIDKYKADYEKVIIAYDDYIDLMMLKIMLSASPDSPTGALQSMIIYKNSKDALNDVMKTLNK